jgi:outer membrane lipoprotein-sorting protein
MNNRRWVVALAIPAVVIAGAIAVPAVAAAQTESSTPTPQQVLTSIAKSSKAHYSGTVSESVDLGLPQLPGLASLPNTSDNALVDLLMTPHSAKVYVDGSDRQRVQVLDQLAERDIIHNGATVWYWNSSENEATKATRPAHDGTPSATPVPTPAEIAAKLVAAADSSTTLSVVDGHTVAGRSVHELVLTPKTSATLVKKVVVSVDTATGVPLRIVVDARGQSSAAVEFGFSSISFDRPPTNVFTFSPPAGAKVTEAQKPEAGSTGAPHDGSSATKPALTGKGWATVAQIAGATLPASLTSDPLFAQLTVPVPGGRALQTSLLSVLMTDDGRVFVGAVPLATLEAAAG